MEKQSVPKLRFPDFIDSWKKQTIGKHVDILTGVPIKSVDIQEDSNCRPILRGINITEGYIRHSPDIDRYYCGDIEGLEKYFIRSGDLVLGMDGSKVGKNVAVISNNDEGSILIQRVARIRPKKSAEIRFIYHHIFSSIFHRYIDIVNTSSGIPHISKKQINDFSIHFPQSLPEQQKIASFLSAVDKKVEQLTRKKELLEEYKKGVMQKLFPKPGEQHPELRFKDENGEDFPDWEVKRLGEIASFIKDGSHGTHKNSPGSGYYLLSAKNLIDGNIIITEDDREISKGEFDSIYKNYKLHEGDILLTIVGTIGRVAKFKGGNKISFQRSVAFFRIDVDDIDFIIQYMNSQLFQRELTRRQVVSAQPGIYLGELSMIPIHLPTLEEQREISWFLKEIDKKILAIECEIQKTQTFKKGLLQQMFV